MTTNFRGFLLPENFENSDLQAMVSDCETMLVSVMQAIADRFDSSYPFVNTKLDLMTGADFAIDDPIRGQNAVYGWIQGRALEALAGHCAWFRKKGLVPDLVGRLEMMMRQVLDQVRDMRAQNGGRLWFFMTPDGQPFKLDKKGTPTVFRLTPDIPLGFSDMFSAKGMFAAACYLGDGETKAESLSYINMVDDAVWTGRFENDQVPLDPTNIVLPQPGRHFHGPFMIELGTAAMLVLQGEQQGVTMGLRLIQRELDHYIQVNGRVDGLLEGDFWEAIDDAGMPYCDENGQVLSDPGHALECVGLVLKFTQSAKQSGMLTPEQQKEIDRIETVMPLILHRNFDNGFLHYGICKAFDLSARKPVNTDSPWWSLPETMRAAALCFLTAPKAQTRTMSDAIFRACHNAFVQSFVRPDLFLMAYQTVTAQGKPVSVIPATADADPGYHTGLSIIDVIDAVEKRY